MARSWATSCHACSRLPAIEVAREYYFNDFGTQVANLGLSVLARRNGTELPEDGYRGEYVQQLAAELPESLRAEATAQPDEAAWIVGRWASERVRAGIEASLERLGVHFDLWKEEGSLHSEGWVERAMDRLRAGGHVYQDEGATWFRSTAFGDDKDRVIVRSNGQPTYFASDIGYVTEKFSRGFDELIYIWGADHHGTVARLRNAAGAMGHDRDAVRVLLIAWVRFVRDGVEIPMSKRSGEFITLDDVLSEVGVDAARWFFSSRAYTTGIDFDLELAKKQSNENPVYYVQYAHARASSILRHAAEVDARPDAARAGELLVHPSEQALIRHLLDFPDAVATAAERRETHEVPRYAYELASAFSAFYRDCKVLTEDAGPDLGAARPGRCDAQRPGQRPRAARGSPPPTRCRTHGPRRASAGGGRRPPQQLLVRGVDDQHLVIGDGADHGREGQLTDHGLVGERELFSVLRRVPRQPPGDREVVVGTDRDADPVAAPARRGLVGDGGVQPEVLEHETDARLAHRRVVDLIPTVTEGGRQVGQLNRDRGLARIPRVEVDDLLGRVRRIRVGLVHLREVGLERVHGQGACPHLPRGVREKELVDHP